mmetsp:Transcript_33861/g.39799  ORF Transcript_33861/g.39799 Transcript_33861/m.39799 type:complete len:99 (-) Transcript_33861:831-1127(-)
MSRPFFSCLYSLSLSTLGSSLHMTDLHHTILGIATEEGAGNFHDERGASRGSGINQWPLMTSETSSFARSELLHIQRHPDKNGEVNIFYRDMVIIIQN